MKSDIKRMDLPVVEKRVKREFIAVHLKGRVRIREVKKIDKGE